MTATRHRVPWFDGAAPLPASRITWTGDNSADLHQFCDLANRRRFVVEIPGQLAWIWSDRLSIRVGVGVRDVVVRNADGSLTVEGAS